MNIRKRIDKYISKFLSKDLKTESFEKDCPKENYLNDFLNMEIALDQGQEKFVLSDLNNTILFGSTSSGKTTAMVTKIKYLIEQKNVMPENILVCTFKKQQSEKLQELLDVPCNIKTIYKFGKEILENYEVSRKQIIDSNQLRVIIENYFVAKMREDRDSIKEILFMFSTYFDLPYENVKIGELFEYSNESKSDIVYEKVKEDQKNIITIHKDNNRTIQNELCRSKQEVEIANFLYLNGIDYKYEKRYGYEFSEDGKLYTPDFFIEQGEKVAYIEHFGITEDGKNNHYAKEALLEYKKNMEDKIKFHMEHKTNLIWTYAEYRDGRSFLEHLKEELLKNGFCLQPRSEKEVIEQLIQIKKIQCSKRMINLICKKITNKEQFHEINNSKNVREQLLNKLSKECYYDCQIKLESNEAIDFVDMLQKPSQILLREGNLPSELNYQYIFIYNYMDFEKSKTNFIKALISLAGVNVIIITENERICDEIGKVGLIQLTNCYGITVNEQKSEQIHDKLNIIKCPICGAPMRKEVQNWENCYNEWENWTKKEWYICTNDVNLCGYMANINVLAEEQASKLSIQKCPRCKSGYLIAKYNKMKKEYFLGCTNYKNDKSGCNYSKNITEL